MLPLRRTALGVLAVVVAVALLVTVGTSPAAASSPIRRTAGGGSLGTFSDPTPVTVSGSTESAMEPFVSFDGHYLLFNTSNVAPSIPALQFAVRSGPQSFTDGGPIVGANQPGFLSGTPTMDRNGHLYFVSTRNSPAPWPPSTPAGSSRGWSRRSMLCPWWPRRHPARSTSTSR
jgi:hypothetical protein